MPGVKKLYSPKPELFGAPKHNWLVNTRNQRLVFVDRAKFSNPIPCNNAKLSDCETIDSLISTSDTNERLISTSSELSSGESIETLNSNTGAHASKTLEKPHILTSKQSVNSNENCTTILHVEATGPKNSQSKGLQMVDTGEMSCMGQSQKFTDASLCISTDGKMKNKAHKHKLQTFESPSNGMETNVNENCVLVGELIDKDTEKKKHLKKRKNCEEQSNRVIENLVEALPEKKKATRECKVTHNCLKDNDKVDMEERVNSKKKKKRKKKSDNVEENLLEVDLHENKDKQAGDAVDRLEGNAENETQEKLHSKKKKKRKDKARSDEENLSPAEPEKIQDKNDAVEGMSLETTVDDRESSRKKRKRNDKYKSRNIEDDLSQTEPEKKKRKFQSSIAENLLQNSVQNDIEENCAIGTKKKKKRKVKTIKDVEDNRIEAELANSNVSKKKKKKRKDKSNIVEENLAEIEPSEIANIGENQFKDSVENDTDDKPVSKKKKKKKRKDKLNGNVEGSRMESELAEDFNTNVCKKKKRKHNSNIAKENMAETMSNELAEHKANIGENNFNGSVENLTDNKLSKKKKRKDKSSTNVEESRIEAELANNDVNTHVSKKKKKKKRKDKSNSAEENMAEIQPSEIAEHIANIVENNFQGSVENVTDKPESKKKKKRKDQSSSRIEVEIADNDANSSAPKKKEKNKLKELDNVIEEPDTHAEPQHSPKKKKIMKTEETENNLLKKKKVKDKPQIVAEGVKSPKSSANDSFLNLSVRKKNIEKKYGKKTNSLHIMFPLKKAIPLSKIKELKENGIVVKTGNFSSEEDQILLENIDRFAREHDIPKKKISKLLSINAKSDTVEERLKWSKMCKDTDFLQLIGKGLGDRTLYAIYRRARTLCDPNIKNLERRQPLTEEQSFELQQLLRLKGPKYHEIARIMNIPASRLTDRVRSITTNKIIKGRFSDEENKKIKDAVASVLGIDKGQAVTNINAISWETVAKIMKTRTAIQCRMHWTRLYGWHRDQKPEGGVKEFGSLENVKLLHLIRESGVNFEFEIDWSSIANEFSNKTSYCGIRQKWKNLKNLVPSSEGFELSDYLNYLESRV